MSISASIQDRFEQIFGHFCIQFGSFHMSPRAVVLATALDSVTVNAPKVAVTVPSSSS